VTVSITRVNTAADSWQILINRLNEALDAIDDNAVTVSTAANGSHSTGNGYVDGIFGANTQVGVQWRGGTPQTPADAQWVSNVFFGNSTVNVAVTNNSITLGGSTGLKANTLGVFISGGLYLNSTGFGYGNSTVNLVANTTALTIGGKVFVHESTRSYVSVEGTSSTPRGRVNFVQGDGIEISLSDHSGGDQVNVVIASTIDLANLAVTNKVTVGSNVQVNTSTLSIGNSTVSLTGNSTQFTFVSGGSSANINLTGTYHGVAVHNTSGFYLGSTSQNSTHQTAVNLVASANVTAVHGVYTGNVSAGNGVFTTVYANAVLHIGANASFGSNSTVFSLFVDTTNNRVGANTNAPVVAFHVAANDAVRIASGTTAQRPSSPARGDIRWNETLQLYEGYVVANTTWVPLNTQYASNTQIWGNTAGVVLSPSNIAGSLAEVTLTDAATIAVNMATGINFVVTLGASRILGFPTNISPGRSGVIRVVQPVGGACTLSFGSGYIFDLGVAPSIDTTASKETFLSYYCKSATKVLITMPATKVTG
jgi:hypothetical protein